MPTCEEPVPSLGQVGGHSCCQNSPACLDSQVVQRWAWRPCARRLPGLRPPPRTPSPRQPGISPWGCSPPSHGGSVQSTHSQVHGHTPGERNPLIPGGHMEMVFQNPSLTPIPKCLFHTKWPSPSPSLAGMGRESTCLLSLCTPTAQATRTATPANTTHVNTREPTMPPGDHWTCPRCQGFPERGLGRPGEAWGGPFWARAEGPRQQPPSSGWPLSQGGAPEPRMCAALGTSLPLQLAAADRGQGCCGQARGGAVQAGTRRRAGTTGQDRPQPSA